MGQSIRNKGCFKYGIWEFLIHDLSPETQCLAAMGYGTDLYFLCIRDQLHIIFDRKFLRFVFFERVCDAQVEWENVLKLCVIHTSFKKR